MLAQVKMLESNVIALNFFLLIRAKNLIVDAVI